MGGCTGTSARAHAKWRGGHRGGGACGGCGRQCSNWLEAGAAHLHREPTSEKVASAKGRAVASATLNVAFGTWCSRARARARSTMPGVTSTPTTERAAGANAQDTSPPPHATSSTAAVPRAGYSCAANRTMSRRPADRAGAAVKGRACEACTRPHRPNNPCWHCQWEWHTRVDPALLGTNQPTNQPTSHARTCRVN